VQAVGVKGYHKEATVKTLPVCGWFHARPGFGQIHSLRYAGEILVLNIQTVVLKICKLCGHVVPLKNGVLPNILTSGVGMPLLGFHPCWCKEKDCLNQAPVLHLWGRQHNIIVHCLGHSIHILTLGLCQGVPAQKQCGLFATPVNALGKSSELVDDCVNYLLIATKYSGW
jgi:hypothetical protein